MTFVLGEGEQIELHVLGAPRPKGSKTAVNRRGGGPPMVIESKSAHGRKMQADWKADVRRAATDWREAHQGELLDAALDMTIVFWLERPKSAPKRQLWPKRKPDFDKLTRLVCDCLKGVIYTDDARVVRCLVEKRFAVERTPGCDITVELALPDPDPCPYCLAGMVLFVTSADWRRPTLDEYGSARLSGSPQLSWCPDCGGTGHVRAL